jgi:hypothetical protein
LTLLVSRRLRWKATIPTEYIDDKLPEDLRKTLLAQVPTVTRKNIDKPIAAKDTCTIHSQEFQGLSATAAFILFRAAAIQILHKHLTDVSHRRQNQIANTLDNLSQSNQALLQVLDSVQPTTPCNTDERHNTMVFTPTEENYNPLRQQAQPYVILLQDPRSINNIIKFSIKPHAYGHTPMETKPGTRGGERPC